MPEETRAWRDKKKGVRGFVHLGEWGMFQTLEEVRTPRVFGLVADDTVTYCDRGCVAVSQVVARCLSEQGIRHEWECVPGRPIFLTADRFLPGPPAGSRRHGIRHGDGRRLEGRDFTRRHARLADGSRG